ncbi:adenosylcobinamide-GDP ribazoletransferase [Chloroflexota bacterium]
MKNILNTFLAAAQFLTITPALIRRPFKPKELGQAVGFYPVIGVLLGAILLVLNTLLENWLLGSLRAALLLTVWIILTGALHLDGLLDSFDGLFGGFTAESRMRIMRDERVGAFALAGGVCVLLIKFSALSSLANPGSALLLAPAIGRWGMSLALVFFPYARSEGLGRDIKSHATWRQFVLGTVFVLVVAWFSAGWVGLALLALAGLLVVAGARFTMQRIPGLTGDIYGALNELVETAVLIGLVFTQAF